VGVDIFGGLAFGSVPGMTKNDNLVIFGVVNITLLWDPHNSDFRGFMVGPGLPSPIPIQVSTTLSRTEIINIKNNADELNIIEHQTADPKVPPNPEESIWDSFKSFWSYDIDEKIDSDIEVETSVGDDSCWFFC